MTISSIDGKLFTALSKIDGRTLSTLSKVDGQTIAAAGPQPTDLSGLQLWLTAGAIVGKIDNDRLIGAGAWPDSSGNSRDGSGNTTGGGNYPQYRTVSGPNSKPCVDFHGGYFDLPNFLTGYTSGEGFVIIQIDADPPADTAHAGAPFGLWTGDGTLDSLFPWTDGNIYEGAGSTVRKTGTNPTLGLTTWRQYNFRTASASYIARLDDSEDVINTGTNTVGWGTTPTIAHTRGTSVLVYGQIADVIFYNRVLNLTERRGTINAYFNNRYGFAYPTS